MKKRYKVVLDTEAVQGGKTLRATSDELVWARDPKEAVELAIAQVEARGLEAKAVIALAPTGREVRDIELA